MRPAGLPSSTSSEWCGIPSPRTRSRAWRLAGLSVNAKDTRECPRSHREDRLSLGASISRDAMSGGRAGFRPRGRPSFEDLGMVRDSLAEKWERGLAACRAFREREGHLRVPQSHREDGLRLGPWIAVRRHERKTGALLPSRAAELEDLGMVWNPVAEDWEHALAACRAFREREGHLRVPYSHREDGFKLGTWIGTRRGEKKRGSLSRSRPPSSMSSGWFGDLPARRLSERSDRSPPLPRTP